jgi:hypothetical protein
MGLTGSEQANECFVKSLIVSHDDAIQNAAKNLFLGSAPERNADLTAANTSMVL